MLLFVAAAGTLAYFGRSLLLPLLAGLAGAYFVNPLVRRLQGRGIARQNAVALVLLAMTLGIGAAVAARLPTVLAQGHRLVEDAPAFARGVEISLDEASGDARERWPLLASVLPAHREPGWFLQMLQERVGRGFVTEHLGSIMSFVILAPVFAFFVLRDGPPAVDRIISGIHPRHIETSVAVWAQLDLVIGRYLRGLALESAGVGVLSGVGLWLLGVPLPFVLGLFAAVVNPIPYIGVLLSLALSLVIALTAQMDVGALGAITALFVVIRLIDDVILVPMTIGRSVHLHPMLVIISIVIGEHALGVLGMVLAVPFVTVVKEVGRLLIEHRRTLARATRWTVIEEIRSVPL